MFEAIHIFSFQVVVRILIPLQNIDLTLSKYLKLLMFYHKMCYVIE